MSLINEFFVFRLPHHTMLYNPYFFAIRPPKVIRDLFHRSHQRHDHINIFNVRINYFNFYIDIFNLNQYIIIK